MSRQHAVITGGTSGLGLAMAKQLAEENYAVTIIGRNKDRLSEAVEELSKIHDDIIGIRADITYKEDLQKSVDKIRERFTTVDFLILNAGVVHVGTLDEISVEDLKQDIDIDLWGTILSAKYFSPFLRENSKVVVVSSALGLLGVAGYSGYCAAKAGAINFAAVLRREYLRRNIRVYVACPADIETPQYDYEFASMPQWMKKKGQRPQAMSAKKAAYKILRKSCGKRFYIMINFEIQLLFFLSKLLPQRIMNFIIDAIFPVPDAPMHE